MRGHSWRLLGSRLPCQALAIRQSLDKSDKPLQLTLCCTQEPLAHCAGDSQGCVNIANASARAQRLELQDPRTATSCHRALETHDLTSNALQGQHSSCSMQPVALSMPHSAVAMQLPLLKTD